MSAQYYSVVLSEEEEQQLNQVIRKGVEHARVITCKFAKNVSLNFAK